MKKLLPIMIRLLHYMDELFRTVSPERIIAKDYHYLARILVKKNANAPKIADEANCTESTG